MVVRPVWIRRAAPIPPSGPPIDDEWSTTAGRPGRDVVEPGEHLPHPVDRGGEEAGARARWSPHQPAAMASRMTCASSWGLSSWRKWPPPSMVVCGWPWAPGTFAAERRVAALRDRVGVAVGEHERLARTLDSTAQARSLSALAGSSGAGRHERREDAGAGLVAVVGERCVVGGDRPRRPARSAVPPFTILPTGKSGRLLRELLPREERLARPGRGRWAGRCCR